MFDSRAYHLKYCRENRGKRNVIQRRWTLKQRALLDEIKSATGCKQCGETHPACLDFHHIVPSTKIGTIANLKRRFGIRRLLEEVAKCDVYCANCHRKHHSDERNT